MKDWFDNLEARERLFVSIGGAVAIMVIAWGLIWVPLDRGHRAAQETVATWEQAVVDIRRLRAATANLGTKRPIAADVIAALERKHMAFFHHALCGTSV